MAVATAVVATAAARAGGGATNGAAATSGAATPTGTAFGDVQLAGNALSPTQGGQGFGMQVSDADCKKVDDVLKAHPKEKKQLDDLRAKMQALRPAGMTAAAAAATAADSMPTAATGSAAIPPAAIGSAVIRRVVAAVMGAAAQTVAPAVASTLVAAGGGGGGGFRGSPEMQAINEQMRAIYTTLNLDPRTAGACARRQAGAAAGTQANAGGSARPQGQSGQGGQGALTPSPEMTSRPVRQRTGLVFVSDSAKTHFAPRIVQLGQGNLDYTEVMSGLKEGERVVMLGALALQAQRQAQQDRLRQNASPLGGQAAPGPGPGGGGPRGGGGGPAWRWWARRLIRC